MFARGPDEASSQGAIKLDVTVRNNNAGHAVPAGLPERRIAVTITTRDATGAAVSTETTQLGRKLVDSAGGETPFWRAVRVESDTRIAVGGQWTSTTTIPAATAKSVPHHARLA